MAHPASARPTLLRSAPASSIAAAARALIVVTLSVPLTPSTGDATGRSAEAPARSRPRIGLALSGGGARGGAHIGVIRVLEELRIPVDFIAGTSIGSIVGGLYGSGLSPADMDNAVQRIDWDAVFRDVPPRERISFRRKEDDILALMPIEIGIGKGGISGKSGFIAGQTATFELRGLTLHTTGIERFDELPIPYRAVAADLDTGGMVVLDHGDLATAMRASMSIPGAFTPVEIDGRTLVDGGIARNLPVDVVRAMGADRIIAVDVGTPPRGVQEEMSALGVYSQAFNVLAKLNVKEQIALLGDDDLLIVPDLAEVKTSDFSRLPAAIAAGEAAARALGDRLRSFSVSEEEFEAFLRRQRVDPSTALHETTISAVEVRGVTHIDPQVITRRLETRPGSTLDLDTLRRDLERVHQSGDFEEVTFLLSGEATDRRLVIEAKEKPYGPGYLRFGLGIDSNFEGDSDFRATIHYRRAHVNRLGAEWKTIVTVGDPRSLTTEFFQPLSASGFWFVEPGVSLEKEQRNLFFSPGDPPEEQSQARRVARLDAGVQFRNWGEIRVGAMRGELDAEFATLSVLPDMEFDLGGWTASATLDQLDNPFFPRRGNLTKASMLLSRESLGADLEYERLQLRTNQAWSMGESTLVGGLEVGTDLGSDIPFFDEFELGGLFNLSGLRRGEIRGDVKGLASLIYYWRLAKLGALGNLYLGVAPQVGGAWGDLSDAKTSDLIPAGAIFFGLDSRLGPAYVAYGQAEGGFKEVYFFLGRAF